MTRTVGTVVIVTSPGSQHGKTGTIVRTYGEESDRPYLVRFDSETFASWTFDDSDLD